MNALRRIGIGLGIATAVISTLTLFLFKLYWFGVWWGGVGVLGGIVFAPLAAIFPFIFLLKEGLSLVYFGIWIAGIAGGALAGLLMGK